jgi:hypothetical protein
MSVAGVGEPTSHFANAGAMFKTLGQATTRGAFKGVELTRKAVSAISQPIGHIGSMAGHLVPISVPNISLGGGHAARIARLFQTRRGRNGEMVMPEEISDDDDGGDLTEAQLQERVDHKYFDKRFDGLRAEILGLPASYAEEHADVQKELSTLEGAQKQRDEQLAVVNNVLKKRILNNYEVFVQGVCKIRDVNGDLVQASAECRESRARLSATRHNLVENGLAIPRLRRRRENLKRLLRVLEAAQAAKARSVDLRSLHASHRFRELVDLAHASQLADPEALNGVTSTAGFLSEWANFVKDPESLLRDADEAMERCIGKRFNLNAYMSAVDAFVCLSDRKQGVKRVAARLLWAGSSAVQRAISDLAGQAQGDVSTIAAGVPPEGVSMCVCQICAKVVDTVVLIKRIIDCHRDIVDRNDPSHSKEEIDFHRELGNAVVDVAVKVGDILQFNIAEAATHLRIKNDITIALHIFYLFSLAIEATSDLGVPAKAMAGARERLKSIVRDWVAGHVVMDRAVQLIGAMENETWDIDPAVSPDQLSIVTNLSPAAFRRDVKKVKTYIAERRPESENPFFDPALALPQDSKDIEVRHFKPTLPFKVFCPSAALIGNAAFVFVCRIVERYPPLATEVVNWLETLCGLYIYIAAANFISVSRMTPLEDQHDFSPRCRQQLAHLRTLCLAVPDLNQGKGSFPPPVYENIRDRFGSDAAHFAIVERLNAVQSGVVIVDVFRETIVSLAPLLSKTVLDATLDRVDGLRACAVELLHVGCHRLANAVFPLDWLAEDLAKTRWTAREGMQPGSYVQKLRTKLEALQRSAARQLRFPSRYMDDLFWKHIAYSVQGALVNGFAVAKKKSDAVVSQMSVDSQAVAETLRDALGNNAQTGGDRQVSTFLRAYFGSPTDRVKWVQDNHAAYRRDDILSWLADEREARSSMEGVLRDAGHDDHVYIEPFIAAEQKMAAPAA